jgi:hypothetical protein
LLDDGIVILALRRAHANAVLSGTILARPGLLSGRGRDWWMRVNEHEQDAKQSVEKATNDDGGQASSLAPSSLAPIRGMLKLLVRASSSRSIPGRLSALLILIVALSACGFLGYFLPALISFGTR